jgi:hypothetical protein
LRLVAEVGQRVEDCFGRAGDSDRRSGTHRRDPIREAQSWRSSGP